jgi:hypothetical protein
MPSVLHARPLSYAVLSEGRQGRGASSFHELTPAGRSYRASSTGPAAPSTRTPIPQISPGSPAPRVRLHQAGPEGHQTASRGVRRPARLRALSL